MNGPGSTPVRKPRRPLPGAADLREYCRKLGTSPTAFARAHNLDRIQLMRVLNGQITRVSVDFADDIARATGGKVPVQRWRQERSLVRVAKPGADSNDSQPVAAVG